MILNASVISLCRVMIRLRPLFLKVYYILCVCRGCCLVVIWLVRIYLIEIVSHGQRATAFMRLVLALLWKQGQVPSNGKNSTEA